MTTDAAREALERLYVHDYDFTHGPSAQCEADHATLSAFIDQMAAKPEQPIGEHTIRRKWDEKTRTYVRVPVTPPKDHTHG